MRKHKKQHSTLRNEALDASPKTTRHPTMPVSEERIRLRAYELHQARGGAPGHDLDDWLLAEHQLKVEMSQVPQDNSAGPSKPFSPQG